MFDIFYIGQKPNLFAHEQPVDSIEKAQQLSRTRYCWVINYLSDCTNFDFLWEPVPWERHQRHAWPSQHQKDAGVYLIPKDWNRVDTNYHDGPVITRLPDLANWKLPTGVEFEDFDYSWHPDATDPPYIYQFGTQHQRTGGPQYVVEGATDTKFVDQLRIRTSRVATAVVEIDHLDGNAGQIPDVTKRVRYFDNYRDTLIRIAKSLQGQHEFVWICSSICDYTNFDFSWHPEQWQATMLHVFPSNEQKFGDTFFMHVDSVANRLSQFKLLDWYDLNFVDISVPRRDMPVILHSDDSHVEQVKTARWAGPLATFTTEDYVSGNIVTVSLWREETKTIVPLSMGASSIVVPSTAIPYVKTQLYDYPHIDKTHYMLKDPPLDIVFISNGEPNADVNYAALLDSTYNRNNLLHHVSNIKGRAAAYHAAATASTTPWFFAVFAKLQVDTNFNWTWQPDRMQEPKHYIFHALNPVNGLVYGHQAMIAYNKQLVLNNPGVGLDFTLDSPHEVVPIMSGTAHYNVSAWQCWRTAFREVLKLKAALPDVEADYRINRWLLPNHHHIDQYSYLGAQDAVEYYNEVDGEFDALKKSYEWEWLASYAFVKRNLTPNQ